MDALPDDVVLRVMALLDPVVARRVSRGVRDALDDTEVTELALRWRGRPGFSSELDTLRSLLNAARLPRLSRVSFENLGRYGNHNTNGLLNALLDRASAPRAKKHLVQLSLHLFATDHPPELLGTVLRALKGTLERLDVPDVILSGKDNRRLEADFLRGLRSLSLLRSLAVGVARLSSLFEALTASGAAGRLERLEIDLPIYNEVMDSFVPLLDEALSAMPSLHSLAIKSIRRPMVFISRMTALQSLCVSDLCNPSEDVPVEVLAALSALTRLELRDDMWWNPPLPPLLPASVLLLPKLVTLHSGRLANRFLVQPGSLPSLTNLGFYTNNRSSSVKALIRRRLPTLKSLTLLYSRTPWASLGLPCELPGITSLVASWAAVAASPWWQRIQIFRPPPSSLRHLELYTDAYFYRSNPVSASAFRGLSSLTSLKLTIAGFYLLSPASYAKLGEGLRQLVRLSDLHLEFDSLDGLRIFLRAAGSTAVGPRIRRVVCWRGHDSEHFSDQVLADTESLCLQAFPKARFQTTGW